MWMGSAQLGAQNLWMNVGVILIEVTNIQTSRAHPQTPHVGVHKTRTGYTYTSHALWPLALTASRHWMEETRARRA